MSNKKIPTVRYKEMWFEAGPYDAETSNQGGADKGKIIISFDEKELKACDLLSVRHLYVMNSGIWGGTYKLSKILSLNGIVHFTLEDCKVEVNAELLLSVKEGENQFINLLAPHRE